MKIATSSFINVPPAPTAVYPGASFPTTAPTNIFQALGVMDISMLSIAHTATNAPNFTIYGWHAAMLCWNILGVINALAANTIASQLIQQSTPIYVVASVALTGSSPIVGLGGLTLQGVKPTADAIGT